MKKAVIWVIMITIFSKILGFMRDLVLSHYYGTSEVSDAYIIALTVPGTVFAFIAAGITASFIPMYIKISTNEGEKQAHQFTGTLLNYLIILCAIISLLTFVFAPLIVNLFAPGFEGELLELTVQLTRISIFGIFFNGMAFILSAYLEVKDRFVVPAMVGIPLNLIFILSIVFSADGNVLLLGVGSVLAVFFQFVFVLWHVYRNGYKYKPFMDWNSKHVKPIIPLTIPVILGISINQINFLIDRNLASQIEIGGISALNYANKLNLFIEGIFIISIITVLYPTISRMAINNDMSGFKKALNRTISIINLIVVPITIGFLIYSRQIVELLFGRGAFTEESVVLTSAALFFYSIGLIGTGLREILSRAFYSLQDTKTPVINAAIGMVMNIVLNIILSKFLGIGGLALATSISAIFTTLLLFVSLRKKIGSLELSEITSSFGKVLCAAIVMGVVSKLSYVLLNIFIHQHLAFFISIIIAVFIYAIALTLLKISELFMAAAIAKEKLGSILKR